MSHKESPDPKSSMWSLIAWYLRVWRKGHQLTGPLMAEIMECSPATISRLETGELRLDEDRAAKIDRKRGTGGLFGLLVWYARLGHNPDWQREHFSLEARAEIIRDFQAITIPGLLQTPEYARALFTAVGVENVEADVESRMARQAVLQRDQPPQLWVLLPESVLDWPIGGREVMRRQLAHLLECMDRPNIGLRVVPRSQGAHAGVDGSFKILSGPSGDVVYTESPGGGRLVPSPREVRSFAIRYDRIGQYALPAGASRELITQVMEAM